MKQFLTYAEKKGASYVEIKKADVITTTVRVHNKAIEDLASSTTTSYAVRVLYNGSLGLASATQPDFTKLVDQAITCAKAVKKNIHLQTLPHLRKTIVTKVKQKPQDISLEEKKHALLQLGTITEPSIKTCTLTYRDKVTDYAIETSEGRSITWNDTMSSFISELFAASGARQESAYVPKSDHIGYEIMRLAPSLIDESLEQARILLQAKLAKGGNFPVIADQKLGGVFTHEAVGHASEADIVLKEGSALADKMHKHVASSSVTIVDDGTHVSHGWTPIDDEACEGTKTTIINKGVLQSFLHSRETAALMDVKPTGNSRTQSVHHMTMPRMTCTYIAPGNSSFEDMLAHVKKGYYLKGSRGGQVDTTKGEFLFNAVYGYYIENGALKYPVKGVSLLGNILDILPQITLVGKDLAIGQGMCGKNGQIVPVSDGSPHILIGQARVGGAHD